MGKDLFERVRRDLLVTVRTSRPGGFCRAGQGQAIAAAHADVTALSGLNQSMTEVSVTAERRRTAYRNWLSQRELAAAEEERAISGTSG
jgi:hypothetical protein